VRRRHAIDEALRRRIGRQRRIAQYIVRWIGATLQQMAVQVADALREGAKGRGDGVELDLLQGQAAVAGVVQHIVGPKEAEREVLAQALGAESLPDPPELALEGVDAADGAANDAPQKGLVAGDVGVQGVVGRLDADRFLEELAR